MEDTDFRHGNDRSSSQDEGRGLADEARRTFDDVKDETVSQAKQTGDYAKRKAESTLESGKSHLAAQVGSVSKAVQRGSESFREDGQHELAHQSERLAAQIDTVRSFIEDYGAEGAYDELRRLGRERPMWMVGGALGLGVAAAALVSKRRSGGRGGRR